MDQLYVHAGLHKTATSSLQRELFLQREQVAAAGLTVPLTGVVPEGRIAHHNLAWDVNQDRRFAASAGTVDDLAAALAGTMGDVLLSSEIFSRVLVDARARARLQELATSVGRELHLIFSLREQVSYVESLYRTILNFDAPNFLDFVGEAVDTGVIRMKESIFPFDYAGLVAGLREAGVTFSILPFDRGETSSRLAPLMGLMGVPVPETAAQPLRLNKHQQRAWSAFAAQRTGRPQELFQEFEERHGLGSVRMGPALAAEVGDRVGAGNEQLAAELGVELSLSDRASVDTPAEEWFRTDAVIRASEELEASFWGRNAWLDTPLTSEGGRLDTLRRRAAELAARRT